jgi:hypothetical protein
VLGQQAQQQFVGGEVSRVLERLAGHPLLAHLEQQGAGAFG